MLDEFVHDPESVFPHLRERFVAIGRVGRVADVEKLFIRQLIDDRACDSEPADPAIKNPDG